MYKLDEIYRVVRDSDGAIIPMIPGNRDYDTYMGWQKQNPPLSKPGVAQHQAVTMRQARLALRRMGLLLAVDAAIAGMEGDAGEDARIEWEYAQELRMDHPLVTALGPALGLTGQQLEELFAMAATL